MKIMTGLLHLFCKHEQQSEWYNVSADWIDEFSTTYRIQKVCLLCGRVTQSGFHDERKPLDESYQIIVQTLQDRHPDVFRRYKAQRVGSGWYIELPIAVSRLIRDGGDVVAFIDRCVLENGEPLRYIK